jgi:hypothetical protein
MIRTAFTRSRRNSPARPRLNHDQPALGQAQIRWLAGVLAGVLVGGFAVGLAGCGSAATSAGPGTASSGSSTDASSSTQATEVSTSGTDTRTATTSATTASSGGASTAPVQTTSAGHTTSVKIPSTQRPTTASSNQADAISQLIQEGGTPTLIVRITKGKVSAESKTAHGSVGQTLRLIVVSDVSGTVKCWALGVSVKIVAGRPAPADLIAIASASYPVTFTPSGGAAIDLVTFKAV